THTNRDRGLHRGGVQHPQVPDDHVGRPSSGLKKKREICSRRFVSCPSRLSLKPHTHTPFQKTLPRARSSQHRVALYNFSRVRDLGSLVTISKTKKKNKQQSAQKFVSLSGEISAQTPEDCTEKKLLEKLLASRQLDEATEASTKSAGPSGKARETFE